MNIGRNIAVLTDYGSCNISNTRKSVSSGYPNPEKWVGKTRRS